MSAKNARKWQDEEEEDADELNDYKYGMASCLCCGSIGPEGHECTDCYDIAMFYVCDINLGEEDPNEDEEEVKFEEDAPCKKLERVSDEKNKNSVEIALYAEPLEVT